MRWSVDQRLTFIETRLYWEGQINRKDLEKFFNISTPQASSDFKQYLAECPENMYYDASEKAYKITPEFHPKYISTDPEEYFYQLKLAKDKHSGVTIFQGFIPDFQTMPSPQRSIQPDVLKAIIKAIREKQALEIQYQSMTERKPRWRWITPHAFGFDGFRWHIRCFCHQHKDFRDFVFGRILSLGETRPHLINVNEDSFWHETITFQIIPHPDLSETQKTVIAREYDMKNDRLNFEVPKAQAFYVLNRMKYEFEGNPHLQKAPHLHLLNRSEIEKIVRTLEEHFGLDGV